MKKNGFTLIEMLVVIAILALLMSVAALSFTSVSKQSRDARRKTDMEQLRGALEQFRSNISYYPTNGQVPAVLVSSGYMQIGPTPPSSFSTYTYSAWTDRSRGSGCNNNPGGAYCGYYEISTTLETTGAVYIITPYGSCTGSCP